MSPITHRKRGMITGTRRGVRWSARPKVVNKDRMNHEEVAPVEEIQTALRAISRRLRDLGRGH